jgi:hypothetical protein
LAAARGIEAGADRQDGEAHEEQRPSAPVLCELRKGVVLPPSFT